METPRVNALPASDCSGRTLELRQELTMTKTNECSISATHTDTHAHNVEFYLDLNGHKLAYYVLLGLEQRFSLIG